MRTTGFELELKDSRHKGSVIRDFDIFIGTNNEDIGDLKRQNAHVTTQM